MAFPRGREWLLTEIRVSGSEFDCLESLKLAWDIIPRCRALTLNDGFAARAAAEVASVQEAFLKLGKGVVVRMALPAGLGKRWCNLHHKIHALLHQLHLVYGASLPMVFPSLVCMCTD